MIKPINGNVVIQPIQEESTQGGIIIPDVAKKETSRGLIVAVEKGSDIKTDQEVIYKRWGGDIESFSEKGIDYLMMPEENLLAIVK